MAEHDRESILAIIMMLQEKLVDYDDDRIREIEEKRKELFQLVQQANESINENMAAGYYLRDIEFECKMKWGRKKEESVFVKRDEKKTK
jgi:hypothetical protein